MQVATEDEIEAVERLLGEIQVAFKDAEKSSRRYEFASEPQAASASGLTAYEGVVDLRARVKEATKKRQMGSGFRNKIRWILRDSNVFKTLSERVRSSKTLLKMMTTDDSLQVVKNVKSLTEMFPAATQKAQDQLAAVELEEVAPPGNSQRLELLLEAAKDVDPILYERAADVKREGHYYENATLADRAIVVFGNQLALGAQDPGTRHEYRNISVSGDTKAIIGDRVGMEDIFTPEERASMKHLSMSDDQDTEA